MREFDKVLSRIGIEIPHSAKILDFGCGQGGTVRALRQQGYDAVGYDVGDGASLAKGQPDAPFLAIGSLLNLRLPFANETFDLVLSDQVFEHVQDQVSVWRELHRVTKVGGHALHVIPARYMPIEGHIYVPFGYVMSYRWWYLLWAWLGVRNEFQKGMKPDEVVERNLMYHVEALRYVPTAHYEAMWERLGFDHRFVTREYLATHRRTAPRLAAKLAPVAPFLMPLYRALQSRHVYLQKR
jgi:SAM-dependent methyltransferase